MKESFGFVVFLSEGYIWKLRFYQKTAQMKESDTLMLADAGSGKKAHV